MSYYNTLSILNKLHKHGILNPKTLNYITLQTRNSSYQNSKSIKSIKETPEFEITKSPEDWKYVERILAPLIVPIPKENAEYPSGWQPQTASSNNKYFIPRNKNFMIPVYLETSHRGMKKITRIRKIQGDVFRFEKDIKNHLEQVTGKPVGSSTNELVGFVHLKGDYVTLVKDYLLKNGF